MCVSSSWRVHWLHNPSIVVFCFCFVHCEDANDVEQGTTFLGSEKEGNEEPCSLGGSTYSLGKGKCKANLLRCMCAKPRPGPSGSDRSVCCSLDVLFVTPQE